MELQLMRTSLLCLLSEAWPLPEPTKVLTTAVRVATVTAAIAAIVWLTAFASVIEWLPVAVGVTIKSVHVPRYVANGSTSVDFVCEFVRGETDERLVLKWFRSGYEAPVFQWIPEMDLFAVAGPFDPDTPTAAGDAGLAPETATTAAATTSVAKTSSGDSGSAGIASGDAAAVRVGRGNVVGVAGAGQRRVNLSEARQMSTASAAALVSRFAVRLYRPVVADAGVYRCYATSAANTDDREAPMTVYTSPSDVRLVYDVDRRTMRCEVRHVYPSPNVTLYRVSKRGDLLEETEHLRRKDTAILPHASDSGTNSAAEHVPDAAGVTVDSDGGQARDVVVSKYISHTPREHFECWVSLDPPDGHSLLLAKAYWPSEGGSGAPLSTAFGVGADGHSGSTTAFDAQTLRFALVCWSVFTTVATTAIGGVRRLWTAVDWW